MRNNIIRLREIVRSDRTLRRKRGKGKRVLSGRNDAGPVVVVWGGVLWSGGV